MAELDLEALKRLSWAETRTRWPAIIAALERIPALVLERDGWRAEIGRVQGCHRQALAERDGEIERLNAGLETFRVRAEHMVAAAREADRTYNAGLESEDDDGIWQTAQWVAFTAAMTALGAALAAATEGSPQPPSDFWREVPCGHPPDPVGWQSPDGLWACHCGRILDPKHALPTTPGGPGPLVSCSKCGCVVLLSRAEPGATR